MYGKVSLNLNLTIRHGPAILNPCETAKAY